MEGATCSPPSSVLTAGEARRGGAAGRVRAGEACFRVEVLLGDGNGKDTAATRIPPATRSELYTPFQPSIDFPGILRPQTSVPKGNRPSREPGYSSHGIAGGCRIPCCMHVQPERVWQLPERVCKDSIRRVCKVKIKCNERGRARHSVAATCPRC